MLTLNEYKVFKGIDPTDDREDTRIEALIPAVSLAIRTYTERDFSEASGLATARTFEYDNSGILDINDCTSVQAVASVVSGETTPMTSDLWTAQPGQGPIYHYLLVHGGAFVNGSPEMGFTRNLDTYHAYAAGSFKPTALTVTATWGWPEVPEDVKLAAFWIMEDWTSRPSSEGVTSEAIAGYARSWGRSGTASASHAIPSRARDILAAYARLTI